jgi:hypothetical protein
MRSAWRRHRGRELVTALILAAFGVHALIPAGFMPGGGALAVQICPEGLPAQLLAGGGASHHHRGSPGGAHTDHCAFGCAGAGGPLPQLSPLAAITLISRVPPVGTTAAAPAVRLVHLPQPRAPPGRLS